MKIHLDGFHCVGWVKSAHGISGELYFQLFAKNADWQDSVKSIFLLPKTKTVVSDLVEFNEFKVKAHKDGLIFRAAKIKDRNLAETFKGAGVYLVDAALKAEDGDRIFLKQLLGFDVVDENDKVLGKIEDFSSNGAQDLLVVKLWNGKSALIPLVEDFIVKVDFDAQVIYMQLPPGLIDL